MKVLPTALLRPVLMGSAFLGAALLVAAPTFAIAQNYGRVTAYNAETLRTYNQDGSRRDAAMPRADLPQTPTTIVAVQSGRVGVRGRDNSTIFLRGLDIDFELNDAGRAQTACRPVASANRAGGAVVAGTRAGGGSSTDCSTGN